MGRPFDTGRRLVYDAGPSSEEAALPDAKRKKNDDPDSLTVRDGRDGPDQVYLQVPNGFEDAQAALKAAGALTVPP